MTAREEGVKSEKRGNEREREKEKKGETKEGKEKEGFSTLARIYRSTFEDSGCGMKNRCIHHGLVDHRGSMEPCRNKPMPFIMIHPSIDRSHKCARHKSSWRGSFGFGFLSFLFFSKMGTIHHRRAERNLLLILRDRLVRSEEKLVFRGISRHCLVDNGMDRGGWRRFEKVVRDSGGDILRFFLVFENLILNRTKGVETIRNNSLNA